MKISKEKFNEIEKLVKLALACSTQKEAKPYIEKLKFESAYITGNEGYILASLVSSVKYAVGNVDEKNRKIMAVNEDLFKLKTFVMEE